MLDFAEIIQTDTQTLAANPAVLGRSRRTTPALPADSLAYSFLLAARAVAAVYAGKSLAEALAAQRQEAGPARAAAQDMAYGTLRRDVLGEFVLARLLQKPLTENQVHALLLVALYRLETRPEAAHTVVDQAVQAAAQIAGGRFKALVNGVLRNALRQQQALNDAVAADAVARWRHPAWWLRRLQRAYPDDWQAIAEAGNQPPPMSLRVNLSRWAQAEALAACQAADLAVRPLGETGLRLEKPVAVDLLPGFFDGKLSVQDWGAQQAALRLAPQNGERVLDACAAPGGKTAHLLEQLAAQGSNIDLLALDVDAGRCRRIAENLQRLGLNAAIKAADCRQTADWWDGLPFDRILADVPCSASGVVRRHPDAKRLRRDDDILRFAKTQRQIIDALWPTLKPGGTLLYATCSVFPEENQGQIDALLVRLPDARLIASEQLLPDADHDGFFYARLVKAN